MIVSSTLPVQHCTVHFTSYYILKTVRGAYLLLSTYHLKDPVSCRGIFQNRIPTQKNSIQPHFQHRYLTCTYITDN